MLVIPALLQLRQNNGLSKERDQFYAKETQTFAYMHFLLGEEERGSNAGLEKGFSTNMAHILLMQMQIVLFAVCRTAKHELMLQITLNNTDLDFEVYWFIDSTSTGTLTEPLIYNLVRD